MKFARLLASSAWTFRAFKSSPGRQFARKDPNKDHITSAKKEINTAVMDKANFPSSHLSQPSTSCRREYRFLRLCVTVIALLHLFRNSTQRRGLIPISGACAGVRQFA